MNLKKNLDYSDILVSYAGKYMKMGWDLVAVNFKGEAALDLDFREPEALWSERLTGWGLEGVQVNLGVRTGAASRLMVLEVHREESLAPFHLRGDWCSGCVAEVGTDREQHYYALPKGWQPPASFFLEAVQIMLFRLALQMARDDYEDRRERQRQGIELARQAGRYKGRRADPKRRAQVVALRKSGYSINKERSTRQGGE